MNLVGKILVWVILLMSLVFMAFTIAVYATQHNWMVKAKELQGQLDDARTKNNSLTQEKAELEKLHAEYIALRQQEIKKLSDETAFVKEEIAKLEANAGELQAAKAQAISTLDAVHKNLEKDRNDFEQLRTQFEQAYRERNSALETLISKTDDAQVLALNYATLMQTNKKLADDLADALTVLTKLGETPEPERHTGMAPANILGQITEVRPTGMVEISLGSDSGLVKGHRLHVFHDDTYLGQIEITMTQPDRAAAKILPEYRTGTIQRGDHVTSKFN